MAALARTPVVANETLGLLPAQGGRRRHACTLIGRLSSTAIEGSWYCRGNCPGRSAAPIEACRKADGLPPYCGSSWTSSFGCFPSR